LNSFVVNFLMDLDLLLIPIELLQSDNEQSDNEQSDIEQLDTEQSDIEQSDIEQSDIRDCYETSDNYKTTDDEYSMAKELFLLRFPNEAKFSYSKLTTNQSRRLNDELLARSKWKIDQECLCVCSSLYEIYMDQIRQIYVKCILLTKNQVFKNAISKPILKPENRHYTLKLYFKNNPLLKFLKNLEIKELWISISYTNKTNTIPFLVKLAKKGLNGAFESKSTFQELCELMIQIAHYEEYKK
ncbi:9531_t:CDS:2, partial [Gigaspora margarita]